MHDRGVRNKDKSPTRFQILKQRFQDFNDVRQKSKIMENLRLLSIFQMLHSLRFPKELSIRLYQERSIPHKPLVFSPSSKVHV